MADHTLIQFIADYGTGDPAFAEVIQKLHVLDGGLTVVPTSVPAFSTVATGFWTGQLALVNPVPGMVIYSNTAPRKDTKSGRDQNEGEHLMYAELDNGVRIVGVNAGYCFSFVKSRIRTFRTVKVANKGSQFRSRDFYPEAVVGIAGGDGAFMGDGMETAVIPDAPDDRIAWIDGYGNMKTTARVSGAAFTPGQPVLLTINGIKRTGYFTDGTFSVAEGQLAFAPGSSGGDDKFMEIFLRGLSAWKDFGSPRIESAFTVSAVS